MKLRIDPSNPNTYRRMVKEGRGKGRGEGYKPWLTVRDLSSKGESSRLQGWRTGRRVIHLFSKLERQFFYTLEWDRDVVDYREQFPLDISLTQRIADELGIRHPLHPFSRRPITMTTDFLITKRIGGREVDIAWSVKPYLDIELKGSEHPKRVRRNWEKFRIEWEYWKRWSVKLAWVTEKNFNMVLARNVSSVHGFFHVSSLAPLTAIDLDRVNAELFPKVRAGTKSLASLASDCDRHFGFSPGKSLLAAKHLIAQGKWTVDFNIPFNPSYPIKLCN